MSPERGRTLPEVRPRLGILGGTFDPPHVGHIVAGTEVRSALGLSEILYVVANDPWQKSPHRRLAPAADRFAMVQAALQGTEGLVASDLEIRRGGTSYTLDTLQELVEAGAEDIHLILGRDAAAALETWHEPERVAELAHLVVVNRPGEAGALPQRWNWTEVEIPAVAVSSTELRERIALGRPVDGLIPAATLAYIRKRRLYRGDL